MRVAGALLAGVTVAACATQGSEAAERRVDTVARRDSIAAVAAATMSESQVLGLLARTHSADSALGALASERGSTRELKDFGRMIMREHMALHREVREAAGALRIAAEEPRVPPDAPPDELRERLLTGPTGPHWDHAYLEYAIAMHRSAKENAARALAATRSPTTKQLIERSVPILQKHLDKAASLRKAITQPDDSTLQR